MSPARSAAPSWVAAPRPQKRQMPFAVLIGIIVVVVAGLAFGVIRYLEHLRQEDKLALDSETRAQRAELDEERRKLELLRGDLEAKSVAAARAAAALRQKAAAATAAAGSDPTKRAEAARLAAEARKMETQEEEAKESLAVVHKKLKVKKTGTAVDDRGAPAPAADPAPGVAPAPGAAAAAAPEAATLTPTAATAGASSPATAIAAPAAPTPAAPSAVDAPTPAAPANPGSGSSTPAPAPEPEKAAADPVPAPEAAPEPATPPPAQRPATIFLREGMTRPSRLDGRDPEYVPAARAAGIEGTVVVLYTIGESGDVERVRVLKNLPVLGAACAATVKRWRFSPYVHEGRRVSVLVRQAFVFKL